MKIYGTSGTGGHVWETHRNCRKEHCVVCEGGLSICMICGCIEGSLPTDCPGIECWKTHGDAIYDDYIDYIAGEWYLGDALDDWEKLELPCAKCLHFQINKTGFECKAENMWHDFSCRVAVVVSDDS